ncbi:MAG: sigma-70 family RNA polymerase sigma factor [Candidatus Melainabacteria bacterium]|nr:sigma-70 family RNA polymerase sigma factor [Candidatus Melainabacteria bacterium]
MKVLSKDVFNESLEDLLTQYLTLPSEDSQRHSLREQIAACILPYVKKLAHGLARRSTDPVEDLVQVGMIGLLKAMDKFNPLAGTSFKTYATYFITGEIRHYLRDKASMIKAPRQMYELYYRMNQIVQRLTEAYGRPPTDIEIAEELECPVLKINEVQDIERRRQMISLDQFMVNEAGEETVYIERLVDERNQENVQLSESRLVLDEALGKLQDELQVVVRMTYFEDMSQTEIAQQLGISQMQVSRRLRKALSLLSKELNPTDHDSKRGAASSRRVSPAR